MLATYRWLRGRIKRGSSGTTAVRSWESCGTVYFTLIQLPVNYEMQSIRQQMWTHKQVLQTLLAAIKMATTVPTSHPLPSMLTLTG